MGDLVLTCTGDLSKPPRRHRVGPRPHPWEAVLTEPGQVAEGVITARSARQLGERSGRRSCRSRRRSTTSSTRANRPPRR
ncbi:MAG: hypothetical protein IPN01_16360 [Deltaproteobacteria bacterium]|nr:hypothetical protein [Deltaproteobacteria bacterium]